MGEGGLLRSRQAASEQRTSSLRTVTYIGRVAHENVLARLFGLVSSRCFPHPLRTFALPSIYSYLPSRTYYAGTAPFCSLDILFL